MDRLIPFVVEHYLTAFPLSAVHSTRYRARRCYCNNTGKVGRYFSQLAEPRLRPQGMTQEHYNRTHTVSRSLSPFRLVGTHPGLSFPWLGDASCY